MPDSRRAHVTPWSWKWIGAGVLAAALFAAWILLPIKEWVGSLRAWIADMGPWGAVIFAGVYVVATVLLVPVSVLTIVAGLAFGLGRGFALVVVSATIGATLAFLVSRYLVHDRVKILVENRPRFKAVNEAVSKEGWKIVALLRLSPLVPFNLQNYFYGITDIKLLHYVPATFVGIMPGTMLYVYLGAAGTTASGEEHGPLEWGFFAAGLIATLMVVCWVTKKAKEILAQKGVRDQTTKKKR
ncbi:MAG: TVP38/TMEM64 family protein [Pseudomonadota bacterium]|nr:TVP38/TMEM64 family protein [Pseudomonadota bacterium]